MRINDQVPKNWQKSAIGDYCIVKRGASPKPIQDSKWWGDDIGWVRISDVTSSRKYLRKTRDTLSPAGVRQSIRIEPGEVILSICATIGRPIITTCPVCIHDGFVWFDGLSNDIDREYFYYYLSSKEDFLASNRQTGTQGNLNTSIVSGVDILLPSSKPEQAKIAEILSTVDRAIEQTEAAIAKQQRIKTGLMQDLLTRGIDEHGNLRSEQTHQFKDSPLGRIPVEWEVECLEKLTKRIVDGVHHTPTYVDSGIPFIVVTDLTAGPGIDFSRTRFVTEYDHRQFSKRADPHPGDVLVTKDGTLGVARVVEEGTTEFSIFVSVAMLRPHLDICLPELIWSFFDSGQFLLQLGALSAGTGLAHIHLEHFRKFLLRIPPIIEQERIFRIVNKHKERLKNLKENMNKQKAIKTALTQDLLTGKKRVTSLLE